MWVLIDLGLFVITLITLILVDKKFKIFKTPEKRVRNLVLMVLALIIIASLAVHVPMLLDNSSRRDTSESYDILLTMRETDSVSKYLNKKYGLDLKIVYGRETYNTGVNGGYDIYFALVPVDNFKVYATLNREFTKSNYEHIILNITDFQLANQMRDYLESEYPSRYNILECREIESNNICVSFVLNGKLFNFDMPNSCNIVDYIKSSIES